MPNSSLTEAQHKSLVRNQKLLSARYDECSKLGLGTCLSMNNPVIHPAVGPVFAVDASLLELARQKNDWNFFNLKNTLHDHMGFRLGCKPLIDGTIPGMDVRPRIADEIVFQIWYARMICLGYRLMTEKAAAELHERGTNIFLRSWLDYYSADFKRSRKIRHAVKLVCPHQQIIDGYEHTNYCLEAAYSRKEYKFSVLAASYHDTTMQGLLLYKPSTWKKPR